MQVGVLGPTRVDIDGVRVDLRTPKERALLAALALHGGSPVSPDQLVDLVWGERPPVAVTSTLHAYIARLRRDLEPDRAARAPSRVILTGAAGYSLAVGSRAVDASRFADAVTEMHHGLVRAPGRPADRAGKRDSLEEASASLSHALGLWRGTPYAELEDSVAAAAERGRLEELRLVAQEDLATVEIALGREATVAADLETLTAAHPLRERLWALRAAALARTGRQRDALAVLAQVRHVLHDELGLEPSRQLADVQQAVLRQDLRLVWDLVMPVSLVPPRSVGTGEAGSSPGERAMPTYRRGRGRRALVGRELQLALLVDAATAAVHDGPRFVVVTGEAGIGKSRLCEALIERAVDLGVRVLVGRCPQGEGAPPLWPWASALSDLGQDLPSDIDTPDVRDRYAAWSEIVRSVDRAARDAPLVVLLEDLHWADSSTLRVAAMLVEALTTAPVLLVCTWRDQLAADAVSSREALAGLAEALARRHAHRVQLGGLEAAEVTRLANLITGTTPEPGWVAELTDKTDGNPFFLIEYLRLSLSGREPSDLRAAGTMPVSVREVLTRRLAGVSGPVRDVLAPASVLGRGFDVIGLVAMTGQDEDQLLAGLELATAAGLVDEDGIDRFRFSHALMRDAVYADIAASRRARLHAQAALGLEGRPHRETEIARHWLAAGPRHAARAWRAASAAAAWAGEIYAVDEAADLLGDAVRAADQDIASTAEERFDLRVSHARALQLADRWVELRPAIHASIAAAPPVDDERLSTAATLPLTGALWQAAGHGFVDELVVTTLRDLLVRLPDGDSAPRCRVMLCLAGELYYGASALEREALVEQAVAMARRLGEPALLAWACVTGATATYRPSTARHRLALLEEGRASARVAGEPHLLSSATTMRVAVLMELGLIAQMEDALSHARELAEESRHHFALMVLDHVELSWRAMRGQHAEVGRLATDVIALGERVRLPTRTEAAATVRLMQALWAHDPGRLVAALSRFEAVSNLPVTLFAATVLLRAGRVDDARARLAAEAVDLDIDSWFSAMLWANAAEIALQLGLPTMAADAYQRLAPLAGGTAHSSALCLGPIDAFLAMAAAAVGDHRLATRHADDAIRLAQDWHIPLFTDWFIHIRRTAGF